MDMLDRSAVLRGFRAMASMEQRQAADAAQISLRTITNAERGTLTIATWDKLAAVYKAKGLRLIHMPTLSGELAYMIAVDCGINEPTPKKRKKRTPKNAGPPQRSANG